MTAARTTGPVPTSSPTRAVLALIEAGTSSTTEIARRSGLDVGVVALAIDRLVASGHLTSQQLLTGCPDGGCGSCPSGLDGRPACGAPATTGRAAGPVLLTLGPMRR